MGSTDKIHDALTAADAPLFVWDARPLAGFIAAEVRDEGWRGHSALSNLIIEATLARDRVAAELTQAGHVPLVGASGNTRVPVKIASPWSGGPIDDHRVNGGGCH
jgi:hypothetical protein